MNYTTIENQIITQSDKETETEIRKIVDSVEHKISDYGKAFEATIRYNGIDHKIKLPARGMVRDLLRQILLEELTVKRRTAALATFLQKFNAVVMQIEDLGIELEGIHNEPEE